MPHSHRKHRNVNKKLLRSLLGISGAILILLSLSPGEFITGILGGLFGVPAFFCGIFGAIISYWKRRFGATFMLIAGLTAFIGLAIHAIGTWAWLGIILLIGCSISAYWHKLG